MARERLLTLVVSAPVVPTIAAIGIFLRLRQYLDNRSLRTDEAQLALNVFGRSPLELTHALDFNQAAPFGFLWLAKLDSVVFGHSEYSLRLLPLGAGLLALFLFPSFARGVADDYVTPLAFALFACSVGLVYWSSDFKPYALDVAVALLLYILAFLVVGREGDYRLAAALGLAGALSVWFSYASPFVFAAIGCALAADFVLRASWRRMLHLMPALVPWTVSAALVALVIPSRVVSLRESFFSSSHGVSSEGTFAVGGVRLDEFGGAIALILGLPRKEPSSPVTKIVAVVALIGVLSLFRKSWQKALMLALPVGLVLAAAAADLYPLRERTVLFLAPIVCIWIAEGAVTIARRARWALVGVGLAGLVLVFPIITAAENVASPRTPEAIKPVITYVREHWREGDVLYLHYASQHSFAYYGECGCFDLSAPGAPRGPLWPVRHIPGGRVQYSPALRSLSPKLVLGSLHSTGADDLRELEQLDGRPRVWFVTGGNPGFRLISDLEAALDRAGRRLVTFRVATLKPYAARAVLYDLRARAGR